MKIVTWNCNGAFRKKYNEISKYGADIYVIQECENPDVINGEYKNWAGNYIWHGANKNKGIGIFARKGLEMQRLAWEDNGLQLFLPVKVNGQFNLVAVWTKQANSPTFRYIGQLWKYLELHKEKMAASKTVLCGDLNSNKIWDVWDRWWNHSDVVRELADAKMHSLYHQATGEDQGAESAATLYLQRNHSKAYHIDFAFASEGMFNPQSNIVSVGSKEQWLEFSDHVPLFLLTSCYPFEALCAEENMVPEQLEQIVKNYGFYNRLPKSQDIGNALSFKPKILERKTILQRVGNKIQDFINTFIEGMG